MNNAAQKEWWFPVSGCIMKSERLTAEQKLVWLVLCSFRDTETGKAYPSVYLIGKLSGLGRDKLRGVIKSLEKLGLLIAAPRRDGKFNRGYVFTVKSAEITEAALNQHLDEVTDSSAQFEVPQISHQNQSMNYSHTTTASSTTAKKRVGSSPDERSTESGEQPILSPDEILSRCAAENVDESLAADWADEVRETGRLSGRIPTATFVAARIELIESSKNRW